MLGSEDKKYVQIPWKSFYPHAFLLLVTCTLVFVDTGITVFNMPIETFIINWLTFPYIIICSFLHIIMARKGN